MSLCIITCINLFTLHLPSLKIKYFLHTNTSRKVFEEYIINIENSKQFFKYIRGGYIPLLHGEI